MSVESRSRQGFRMCSVRLKGLGDGAPQAEEITCHWSHRKVEVDLGPWLCLSKSTQEDRSHFEGFTRRR